MNEDKNNLSGWRLKVHDVIYEADTPMGKFFDIVLIISIIASIAVVMMDSVNGIQTDHKTLLTTLEWIFTIIFTIEYIMRIICIGRPSKYIFSFYGMVDLLSIIPTYLAVFVTGTHYLAVIRILRILRIFRILKLSQYINEANVISRALIASRKKIIVFLTCVILLAIILGSIMFVIEGPEHGFTSIPKSVYWAIVTLTTVGFGDLHPKTDFGQFVASIIMLLGYAIIAVPTGIVTAELGKAIKEDDDVSTQSCTQCTTEGHIKDANFCFKCGYKL